MRKSKAVTSTTVMNGRRHCVERLGSETPHPMKGREVAGMATKKKPTKKTPKAASTKGR